MEELTKQILEIYKIKESWRDKSSWSNKQKVNCLDNLEGDINKYFMRICHVSYASLIFDLMIMVDYSNLEKEQGQV